MMRECCVSSASLPESPTPNTDITHTPVFVTPSMLPSAETASVLSCGRLSPPTGVIALPDLPTYVPITISVSIIA